MQTTLFGRLGSFAARRRWWVIAAWAVLFVTMGIFAPGLPKRLTPGGFEVPGSEGLAVQQKLSSRFTQQFASTAIVVVSNPTSSATGADFAGFVHRLTGELQAMHGVEGVVSFYSTGSPAFVSRSRHTTYLVVGLAGGQNEWLETSAAIVEKSAEASSGDKGGFEVVAGGQSPFFNRLSEVSKHDIEKAELFAFPITALVLLLAFGTLVAAGLPLLLGLLSLVVTLGALWFLTHVTDMSIFVTNTASIIGIGVGIDYALFVVTRFREELRHGRAVPDAISAAMASSGRAVALSGATVVVALAGLFLVDIQAFRSMAIGSMSVVAVAVMAAVTFLPALLAVAGPAVDRFRLPFVTEPGMVSESGFWHRWAMVVMRRPWSALAGSAIVLAVLAAPFFAIKLGYPGPGVLPLDEQPRIASERLAQEFGPGIVGPIDILVDFRDTGRRLAAGTLEGRTPGGATAPQALARIDDLTRRLAGDPAVAGVQSVTSAFPSPEIAAATLAGGLRPLPPQLQGALQSRVNWDRGADLAYVTAIPRVAPESPEAEDLIARIRRDIVPASGLAGRVEVGGATALNLDLSDAIESRMPVVVAAVLALSFLLLAMAFRSLLLPLKAIVMNLLSVGAAYGLIVALFQWGWAERVMGFTSNGHIEVFVPLFLFSVLFGLSMDYEVFLMSRMREEYVRTGSNEQAVARGLEGTARTITSAAAVMVVVFVAFSTSRVLPFKEMGLGLPAAVLIDATLVRTVLVPAAMRLMGDWNWWMPAWLDRLLPKIALEGSGTGSLAEPPTLVGHGKP
jgi:RND superfamily putative drug exporter